MEYPDKIYLYSFESTKYNRTDLVVDVLPMIDVYDPEMAGYDEVKRLQKVIGWE